MAMPKIDDPYFTHYFYFIQNVGINDRLAQYSYGGSFDEIDNETK
jgi:hypothetical protein